MSPSELDLTVPVRRVIAGHDAKGTAIFAPDDILTSYDPGTAPIFSATSAYSGFGVIQIHRRGSHSVDNQRLLSEPHRTLGTVSLITDGGAENVLREHDVAVVRATNHEGVNRGKEVARLFAVVAPSLEIVTEAGKHLEKTEAGEIYDPKEEDDD
ncbi:MAG: hypothetical protein M1818_005037 [Claussenomyces sp. TS43310]|nr:MAG: hypothetical protein M1818_005037 [Claussenomyces sp. TS43310]